jgi:hypothetical protein
MNEHQSPGALPSGGRTFPTASPGGNSPVLGGPTPGMGAPGRSGPAPMSGAGFEHDHRPEPRHVDLPHRMPTRRDETVRAGQHQYGLRGAAAPDRHRDTTVQTLAFALGGGLLVGWLMSRFMRSSDRDHDSEQERYQRRRSREYAWSDTGRSHYATPGNRSVVTDETWDLIASDKVEGTAVFDRTGERLGSVYNFMVAKRSGQVAYAVMSFGGWLGMGESYHPLPWNTLTYDTDLGGYVVSLNKDRLRNAPSHKADQDTSSDVGYWRRVKDYWASR